MGGKREGEGEVRRGEGVGPQGLVDTPMVKVPNGVETYIAENFNRLRLRTEYGARTLQPDRTYRRQHSERELCLL